MIRNIAQKFRNSSPAIKASMALLFANLVLKGLSLISGPIFTRIMPTDQYGIVSTFNSWQSMLTVLITLNLSAGVFNNGMLDFKNDRDSFQFSLLSISSCISIIGFIVFLGFKKTLLDLFELPELTVYLMLLNFLFVPAYSLWSGRQRYEYKYKALSIITIVSALLTMAIGVIGVLIVDSDNTATVRIIAMESVSIIIGVVFYIISGIKSHFKVNIKYCVYALKFNVPLIPHYLSMYVLASSDRIMITKMIDTTATAIYSVAYTVASVITIVWQSIDASLSPWIYEKLSIQQKEPIRKITVRIILMFAVMCVCCTLFAPEIMMILAPSAYSSGVYVIPPVSVGVFFTAVYSIYMRIELYYKQTFFSTIATTTVAALNVALNYIFISIFGAIAAGYTTMICYAALALLHYINVKKRDYSDIINNKAVLLLSIAMLLLSSVVSVLYMYTIVRFILSVMVLGVLFIKRKAIISMLKFKKE